MASAGMLTDSMVRCQPEESPQEVVMQYVHKAYGLRHALYASTDEHSMAIFHAMHMPEPCQAAAGGSMIVSQVNELRSACCCGASHSPRSPISRTPVLLVCLLSMQHDGRRGLFFCDAQRPVPLLCCLTPCVLLVLHGTPGGGVPSTTGAAVQPVPAGVETRLRCFPGTACMVWVWYRDEMWLT